jgi:F0F1-type ATP synthase assembly protein I
MAKTRMTSPRDTTPHSAAEMKRRLLFVIYAFSIPVAVLAFIVAGVRHDGVAAVAGGLAIVAFVALHLTRSRWGAKDLADEIARNPFKSKRVPKEPGEGLF